MMLKVVVLPAPLGPMRPTISHSPARSVTSLAACTPPKRMEQPRVSSTDIGHPHLALAVLVDVEPLAPQPTLEGPDLLADASRMGGEGEQQQQRPDDQGGVLLGQHVAVHSGNHA